jgi:hypothetical protein
MFTGTSARASGTLLGMEPLAVPNTSPRDLLHRNADEILADAPEIIKANYRINQLGLCL